MLMLPTVSPWARFCQVCNQYICIRSPTSFLLTAWKYEYFFYARFFTVKTILFFNGLTAVCCSTNFIIFSQCTWKVNCFINFNIYCNYLNYFQSLSTFVKLTNLNLLTVGCIYITLLIYLSLSKRNCTLIVTYLQHYNRILLIRNCIFLLRNCIMSVCLLAWFMNFQNILL